MLETPAFESLYGGQFTLSTQLIKPNYIAVISSFEMLVCFNGILATCERAS